MVESRSGRGPEAGGGRGGGSSAKNRFSRYLRGRDGGEKPGSGHVGGEGRGGASATPRMKPAWRCRGWRCPLPPPPSLGIGGGGGGDEGTDSTCYWCHAGGSPPPLTPTPVPQALLLPLLSHCHPNALSPIPDSAPATPTPTIPSPDSASATPILPLPSSASAHHSTHHPRLFCCPSLPPCCPQP